MNADIDIAQIVLSRRREDRGELTDDFLAGFEEALAEFIAVKYQVAAADVMEQLGG